MSLQAPERPIILVLDDEPLQLATVRAQLADLGTIQEFKHPKAALDFARNIQVDAAIVDLLMPDLDMDGVDFLEQLREFDTDVAVVIRTSDEKLPLPKAETIDRQLRRIIKARSTRADLFKLATEAIADTRNKRAVRRRGIGRDPLPSDQS